MRTPRRAALLLPPHHMLLNRLPQTRVTRIAISAIIIGILLVTTFIRPESDFYSGLFNGVRIGLILVVMLSFNRRRRAGIR